MDSERVQRTKVPGIKKGQYWGKGHQSVTNVASLPGEITRVCSAGRTTMVDINVKLKATSIKITSTFWT